MAITPQSAPMSDPGLFDRWKEWLGAPQNRAALLQTGLSLMQPVQPGQSQFGHIASSIGQGLGAAGRAESRMGAERLAQQKLDRELEGEALDREIKRSGLELERLNTESMIGDRAQDTELARTRLGLDKSRIGLENKKTEAEIANLQGKGGVTLSDMFKASKDIAEISSLSGESIEGVTQKYLDAQKVLSGALQGQSGQSTPPQVPPSTLARPRTRAERDSLPPGTRYIAPNGEEKIRGQNGG